MMSSAARLKLREILDTEECLTCASVFDPLSSRMAESIGFKVGILGGSVASLMSLGAPDIYLLTLSELVQQARRVCQASDLPVIVDGDNGYGNSLNVMRTIEELEHAGAAVVTLEDTVIPKPYNQSQPNLSTIEEGCSKLMAALKVRHDPNMAVFARTHAGQEPEQLLERVAAYSRTGVDGICLFGSTDTALLDEINRVTDLPLMLIDYDPPEVTREQLMQRGVRINFAGHKAYEEAVRAVYQSLLQLYNGQATECERSAGQVISRFARQHHYSSITDEFLSPS